MLGSFVLERERTQHLLKNLIEIQKDSVILSIHKQTFYISMSFKIAPLLSLLLLTLQCNEPSKMPILAQNPNKQDTIGGIPLKDTALMGMTQDSTKMLHDKGVAFFNAYLDENQKVTHLNAAQFYFENEYRLCHQLSPQHWTTGKALFNLGNIAIIQKDFIAAQRYLEKALLTDVPTLRNQIYIRGEMNIRLADCYNELAEARLAKNHYLKAIEIFDSLPAYLVFSDDYKAAYLGLANYYKMANSPIEAMTNLQKYRTLLDIKNNSDIGKYSLTEGSILRLQKKYALSIAAFQRALTYLKTDKDVYDKGGTYIELAKTQLDFQQFAEARIAVDTGLKIWLNQEHKIQDLIEGYLISGKIYEKVGNRPKAIEEYDKAGRFGRDYGWFLFEPLYEKAQLLTQQNQLKEAYQTYLSLDIVILKSRFQIKSDSAKLTWTQKTHHAYEKMIGLAAQLHDKTMDKTEKKEYLSQIRHFLGHSKAVLLTANWAKKEALSIANVPKFVLETEQNIYKTLLINQKSSDKNNNIQKATDELFQFEKYLEAKYPDYYAAKYAYLVEAITSAAKIISYLKKSDDVGLIAYYYGEHTIYSLAQSGDSLFLHQIPVHAVDSALKTFQTHCENGKSPVSDTALARLNFYLYQQLVEPILVHLPKKVNRLRIARDGLLNHLSFDLLFTRPCDTLSSRYPLLLQKYSISYLETQHQATLPNNAQKQVGFDFGAIGFYYDTLSDVQKTLFPKSGHYWSDKIKTTLKYSTIFKNEIPHHRMMIFGGHGQANFEYPLESMLAFPFGDSLNILDLIGFERGGNQLIVPLACQTGLGVIVRGEGMLSLSRGLMQCGYPAVTGSLWNVPEETSAIIISLFTKNLQKGMPKDRAMQQAKIAFLNQELAQTDRVYRNWAGHVLYGNVEPIDFQSNYFDCMLWMLPCLVAIAGMAVWKFLFHKEA
jgi:CHAT domain-containing protein/tetratricopeptide (TPR) repeat protein